MKSEHVAAKGAPCHKCGSPRLARRTTHKGKYETYICRPCDLKKKKKWYDANKDKILAEQRAAYPKRRMKQAWTHLKKRFGISESEYLKKLRDQMYLCDVCRLPNGKTLAVDHDHKTGKLRSLLCSHCNIGLGCFKDSPELLRAAASYLERHADV